MTLSQANDFLTESETLHTALATLDDDALRQITQFKGWSIEDVLVHLHFWNLAADLSSTDEAAFKTMVGGAFAALQSGGSLREVENATIAQRGATLRETWISQARNMAARWRNMDPKTRLPWVGPSMSARSSITARQMETWAHGFEVFDLLGLTRSQSDRIKNIVVLGVNTFGWSHKVQSLPTPETMPQLSLTSPSGEIWTFGEDTENTITGPAVDFAAVVTQTRAFDDTSLIATGAAATQWMQTAQCFAGPPETPPAAGTRTALSS